MDIFKAVTDRRELLAQLVEQRPFKAWVLGSSPRQLTTYVTVMNKQIAGD